MSEIGKAINAEVIVIATAVILSGFLLATAGIPAFLRNHYLEMIVVGLSMIILGLRIKKLRIAWVGLAAFAYNAVLMLFVGTGLVNVVLLVGTGILLIFFRIIYSSKKPSIPFWRESEFYGLLGFIIVISFLFPIFLFPTRTEEIALLLFVIGAAVAVWGCYRNALLAWLGSILVFALHILSSYSVGLLIFRGIGVIFLLVGAFLKTSAKQKEER